MLPYFVIRAVRFTGEASYRRTRVMFVRQGGGR